jgi:transposase
LWPVEQIRAASLILDQQHLLHLKPRRLRLVLPLEASQRAKVMDANGKAVAGVVVTFAIPYDPAYRGATIADGTRRVAGRLKVSQSTVTRVWRRSGLQPHRLERYRASSDPEFERKAADILSLYLESPAHAAVFCTDEKTAIQALDRRDPVLPLRPGRAERHGFEYVRHGTLSLFAALEVATGHVEGMTAPRHTSADSLSFLEQVVASTPKRLALHLIVDNLSAHKTKAVHAWVAAQTRVRLRYTPTYSSWLNQVELWFGNIERDCLARGIFTSTADLRRKPMQYIRLHNKTCRPFHWVYSNPKR